MCVSYSPRIFSLFFFLSHPVLQYIATERKEKNRKKTPSERKRDQGKDV